MVRSICLICLLAGTAQAASPYDEMLKYVPSSANAIALIDVKAAFASPLARAEKWAEQGQPDNRGGLGFVPMDAEQVVIAADVNLNTMSRNLQVGLVKVRNVPPMRELAAREGGSHDEIADRAVVLSPRDVYYVAMSASELAAVFPADRQNTARWIRAARSAKTSPLTGYLKSAADGAAANTVTIAVDLEDVIDRHILKLSLPTSPTVAKNKAIDVARLAQFLSSIKGLTFKARVDKNIAASLTWDFGFDPTQYRKTLPNLMLEVIDGMGVSIPVIETWEVSFTETSMTMSGSLSSLDLKRIVSLFAFPSANEEPTDPAVKENTVSVAATKRYLATVNAIIDELRKTINDPYYGKTATWHEKAAAQIEHLSRLRVDPDAVNAALQSAKRLHAIAASLRGVPIDVDAIASQGYYYVSPNRSIGFAPGSWWGWRPYLSIGPSTVETNINEVQAAINKVVADDQKRRTEAWSQIDRIMAETRKTLSERYKITF